MGKVTVKAIKTLRARICTDVKFLVLWVVGSLSFLCFFGKELGSDLVWLGFGLTGFWVIILLLGIFQKGKKLSNLKKRIC